MKNNYEEEEASKTTPQNEMLKIFGCLLKLRESFELTY